MPASTCTQVCVAKSNHFVCGSSSTRFEATSPEPEFSPCATTAAPLVTSPEEGGGGGGGGGEDEASINSSSASWISDHEPWTPAALVAVNR